MTDNITIMIDFGSLTTWIQIVVTLGVLYAAIWAGKTARKSLQLNTFSSLLKEISSEQARRDRGLVKDIQSSKTSHLKELIELVINKDTSYRAELGRAAERTIARMDRVGYYLFFDGKTPKPTPPIWLWTLVEETWMKLGTWVKFRQNCKNYKKYYHKGYGLYFKKLEDYRTSHNS